MATVTIKIDGDISLADIKGRCERKQGGGFQISSITGKEEGDDIILLFNATEFTTKMSNKILNKLTFVEVKSKKKEDIEKERKEIKEKMEKDGQTLLCDVSDIFAEKNATKVMVFGKKG